MCRRRVLACAQCRKKKLRCDHNQPCSNCLRSRTRICTYDQPLPAVPSRIIPDPQSTTNPDVSKQAGCGRIAELPGPSPKPMGPEEPSSEFSVWHSSSLGSVLVSQTPTPTWSSETAMVGSPEKLANHAQPAPAEKCPSISSLTDLVAPVNAIMAKSRYISPSHWLYSTMLASFPITRVFRQCV